VVFFGLRAEGADRRESRQVNANSCSYNSNHGFIRGEIQASGKIYVVVPIDRVWLKPILGITTAAEETQVSQRL